MLLPVRLAWATEARNEHRSAGLAPWPDFGFHSAGTLECEASHSTSLGLVLSPANEKFAHAET